VSTHSAANNERVTALSAELWNKTNRQFGIAVGSRDITMLRQQAVSSSSSIESGSAARALQRPGGVTSIIRAT